MSQSQTMTCPGCLQLVEVSKYGEHMLKSTPQSHSNVGVVQATMSYPVVGTQPLPPKKEGKHFLIRWKELWEKDPYGMMTFSFFIFVLGVIIEFYR